MQVCKARGQSFLNPDAIMALGCVRWQPQPDRRGNCWEAVVQGIGVLGVIRSLDATQWVGTVNAAQAVAADTPRACMDLLARHAMKSMRGT